MAGKSLVHDEAAQLAAVLGPSVGYAADEAVPFALDALVAFAQDGLLLNMGAAEAMNLEAHVYAFVLIFFPVKLSSGNVNRLCGGGSGEGVGSGDPAVAEMSGRRGLIYTANL